MVEASDEDIDYIVKSREELFNFVTEKHDNYVAFEIMFQVLGMIAWNLTTDTLDENIKRFGLSEYEINYFNKRLLAVTSSLLVKED